MPLIDVNRPCCICGTDTSTHLFTNTYKKKKVVAPFHMRKCNGCGLLFCSPRIPDDRISDYYDETYYVFHRPDADYFFKSADICRRTVGLAVPPPERRDIVEIGSGKGYLLALLKDMGWRIQGIELAANAAAYAQEQFAVPTYCGTLEDFTRDQPDRRFPIIACIDLIEHVTDPASFVTALASISAPGSLLVIDTPNGQAAHIETEGGAWRGFNPYHIYLFNPDNLTHLLERHGFLVLRSFTYNNHLQPQRRAPAVNPDGSPMAAEEARMRSRALCLADDTYFDSEDASAPLAADRRGENLVLIAVRDIETDRNSKQ